MRRPALPLALVLSLVVALDGRRARPEPRMPLWRDEPGTLRAARTSSGSTTSCTISPSA